MPERSKDWLAQAKRDFEAGRREEDAQFYEWACFIYQQSAEKALKAVYQKLGGECWGHSVYNLLRGLQEKIKIDEDLLDRGKTLDKYYISTRYPNGWCEGFPGQFISKQETEYARNCAEKILRFCESVLA